MFLDSEVVRATYYYYSIAYCSIDLALRSITMKNITVCVVVAVVLVVAYIVASNVAYTYVVAVVGA